MMRNSTVRGTYVPERQTQEVQLRIEQTIIDDAIKARGGRGELRVQPS